MNLKKFFLSPYLLLGMAVLFWSGNFILGRGLHDRVPPIALSFWRWLTALMMILPFALWPMLKQRDVIFRYWKQLLVFGLLGVAGFSTLVYIGLKTTTATNGVLLNTTNPVFIILISHVFLKHHLSWQRVLGVALALMGVAVIVTQGDLALLVKLKLHQGDIYVLAGVLSWAMYSVYLHRRPPELTQLAFVGITVLIGTITILPFFLWELAGGAMTILSPTVLGGIFYLALFPSILAYIFWNHAVAQVGASKAGLSIYLMPVFGVLLSSLFLGEAIHVFHMTGMALIFAGIYLTNMQKTP
ncbi:MAG: DMT family transporter [Deltaproteobacteria bacterium]|nr:DMT family transporter [Deltaproteobacteria bacterium]